MTRPAVRSLLLGAIIAPLSLALTACGENAEDGASMSGDPIAEIAAPDGTTWSQTVATTPEGGYLMGNPDAPIKLVEYASLTCPHCASFSAASGSELEQTFVDSGRVSYEFRNFILNPLDLTMAMVTRCGAPESYFALTSQVFANQPQILETWTAAGQEAVAQAAEQSPDRRYVAMAQLAGLPEFFAARGVSTEQANACLADGAKAEELVERTTQQSEELDITGTPTFFINGNKLDGNTWPAIKTQLENMGAR